MIWRDLVISSVVSKQQLTTAVSHALGVDRTEVSVLDSIEQLGAKGVSVLEAEAPGGDFPCVLSIYLATEPVDSEAVIRRIATELGSSVLAADDTTIDPYEMLLFEPGRVARRVRMVSNDLDVGRYTIDAVRTTDCVQGSPSADGPAESKS